MEIFPSTQEHQEEPVPLESTTDHHPVNETPVHPVELVIGTTPLVTKQKPTPGYRRHFRNDST